MRYFNILIEPTTCHRFLILSIEVSEFWFHFLIWPPGVLQTALALNCRSLGDEGFQK